MGRYVLDSSMGFASCPKGNHLFPTQMRYLDADDCAGCYSNGQS